MYIKNNISLQAYNTFGIEAKARFFSEIRSHHILKQLYVGQITKIRPLIVLGAGSNVLFTRDYDGLVLLNATKGIKLLDESDDDVLIEVNSGESWDGFVNYTLEKGWYGLENLSLIPGTVGAAPIQNIGAYGHEVKDYIRSVKAFDIEKGKVHVFTNEACKFSYRSSVFKTTHKGRYFIVSVTFNLTKIASPDMEYGRLKDELAGVDPITPKDISEAVKRVRRSKLPDPDTLKNAGSFFKNPEVSQKIAQKLLKSFPDMPSYPQANGTIKLAAGWLIEQAGWKGKKIGDAGVHDKQALVLVNHGNASGMEILSLSTEIQRSVFKQFAVKLDREVNVIW